MKIKICFVSHSSGKGGAERSLLELIDALKGRGVEAYVLLPSCGPLVEELKSRSIVYKVLPFKWWMGKNSPIWKRIGRFLLNLSAIIPIAITLRRWKCDLVYTNTITVCVGALAAKLLRLPHIWHIHEFGNEDHGLLFDLGQKLSLRLIDRLSTICIANSHAVAKKYRPYIKPSKLKVVYQSVTVLEEVTSEKVEKTSAGMRCVIVGSLQEGKRQEDAIRAIGKLLQDGKEIELYIVGDGDPKYREFLQNLVIENKAEHYIKFLGYVDNPFSIIKSADVVLMCSRAEAFGRVTIEAMKLGKPVIGAKSGGTVELIYDGFNGLLYSVGDYVELAHKIRYLYEHPEIRRQIGENAQKWAAARFTQEYYGEKIMEILKEVIKYQTAC